MEFAAEILVRRGIERASRNLFSTRDVTVYGLTILRTWDQITQVLEPTVISDTAKELQSNVNLILSIWENVNDVIALNETARILIALVLGGTTASELKDIVENCNHYLTIIERIDPENQLMQLAKRHQEFICLCWTNVIASCQQVLISIPLLPIADLIKNQIASCLNSAFELMSVEFNVPRLTYNPGEVGFASFTVEE